MKGKARGETVVRAKRQRERKRQNTELEVAEVKMLMFSLGVTKMDRVFLH